MLKNTDEKPVRLKPPETMASLVWRRFRRHPGALIGAVILSILIISVAFANLSPYDPEKSDIANRYQPPSWAHPFGTDGLGRDLLIRVLYGGRVSLSVGLKLRSAFPCCIGSSIRTRLLGDPDTPNVNPSPPLLTVASAQRFSANGCRHRLCRR